MGPRLWRQTNSSSAGKGVAGVLVIGGEGWRGHRCGFIVIGVLGWWLVGPSVNGDLGVRRGGITEAPGKVRTAGRTLFHIA